jgi:hypothetical protein
LIVDLPPPELVDPPEAEDDELELEPHAATPSNARTAITIAVMRVLTNVVLLIDIHTSFGRSRSPRVIEL